MSQTSEQFGSEMASVTSPREGRMTKTVENMTSQVPSLGYMGLAFGSMALAIGIGVVSEKKWLANFVGHWVPTLLLIGIYNKLVKLEGSDRHSTPNLH